MWHRGIDGYQGIQRIRLFNISVQVLISGSGAQTPTFDVRFGVQDFPVTIKQWTLRIYIRVLMKWGKGRDVRTPDTRTLTVIRVGITSTRIPQSHLIYWQYFGAKYTPKAPYFFIPPFKPSNIEGFTRSQLGLRQTRSLGAEVHTRGLGLHFTFLHQKEAYV